jgi:hypothetical protein
MKISQFVRVAAAAMFASAIAPAAHPLRIATFQADVTPPLGTPLCCEGRIKPAEKIVDPLSARGIVLIGAGKPIVLVSVDWVGIAGEGNDAWRQAIAEAAGTSIDRVTVHTIHAHDTPSDDPNAEALLKPFGLNDRLGNRQFIQAAIERTAAAVRTAMKSPAAVTHLRFGQAAVEKVASNRRILGPNGRVKFGRMSSCKVPEMRAEPEGVIDPLLRSVSFWNGNRPLAVLTTYASHPQSYYGKGGVSADIVGMARSIREAELPGVALIHFDGAGGNVAAGKYNDGSPEMRPVLAKRLAAGMKAAWESGQKVPIRANSVDWKMVRAALPVAEPLRDLGRLHKLVEDPATPLFDRLSAARNLSWAESVAKGRTLPLFRLQLGSASMLFMPGELFVEYQLAAQKLKPSAFVAMAAYGDYGPGYIGTRIAYAQGGYETGPASRTSPDVEDVMMGAIRSLLQ